jgi:hypothetical protein
MRQRSDSVCFSSLVANVLVFYLSFSQIVTKISNNFFGIVS